MGGVQVISADGSDIGAVIAGGSHNIESRGSASSAPFSGGNQSVAGSAVSTVFSLGGSQILSSGGHWQ
ncbi:Adhesin aidA-I [Granulibacter bethesdensis]|uniref:Adhesin aidA-I n=1 Tax=Granulibacter bethesdensis TaxID=364410 RepID=A0AAC9P8U7_9PROT|nr:Adhesin aidA-I [Granulibacter bethesdensis]APH62488.1 Adhesin aidA-I [Granulibacter bethesdensis]